MIAGTKEEEPDRTMRENQGLAHTCAALPDTCMYCASKLWIPQSGAGVHAA